MNGRKLSLPLAPMSRMFQILTYILILVPLTMMVLAEFSSLETGLIIRGVLMFTVAVYSLVWMYFRPYEFEISDTQIVVRWRRRTEMIDRASITSVTRMSIADFKKRYPRPIRVGAGGLGGVFGSLWTKRGWVRVYCSTLDDLVLIERGDKTPWLISPAEPHRFVAALGFGLRP